MIVPKKLSWVFRGPLASIAYRTFAAESQASNQAESKQEANNFKFQNDWQDQVTKSIEA